MSFTMGESAIIELAKRAYTAGGYDLAALLLFGMLRKWWRLERVKASRRCRKLGAELGIDLEL